MYYEEYGIKNKKTIIFLHGAMWPRSLFKQEELSDEYHTVFFQMDGHGKEFEKKFERQNVIDKIIKYIDENKIEKPHIVGFSLGTQIVLQIMNDFHNKIDKVVLLSPLTDATDEDIRKLQFFMKTLAKLVKLSPLNMLAANLLKIENSCKEDFYEEMKNQKVDNLVEEIMSEKLILSDLENLSKIKNDVYIGVGLRDADSFIETGKKLKSLLTNSTLILFERCGHNIPVIRYKKLNKDLRIFFSEK